MALKQQRGTISRCEARGRHGWVSSWKLRLCDPQIIALHLHFSQVLVSEKKQNKLQAESVFHQRLSRIVIEQVDTRWRCLEENLQRSSRRNIQTLTRKQRNVVHLESNIVFSRVYKYIADFISNQYMYFKAVTMYVFSKPAAWVTPPVLDQSGSA